MTRVNDRHRVRPCLSGCLAGLVLLPVAVGETTHTGYRPPVSTLFTNVSADRGFNVQSTNNNRNGSGLHWADLDNDGDLDAIITGNNRARVMISNDAGDSFFVSDLGSGGHGRAGALIDADNDGDIDFWHRDRKLFLNNGSGLFTDEGDRGFVEPSDAEGIAAVDLDGDGWADLVFFSGLGNWVGMNDGVSPVAITPSNSSSYGFADPGDYGNGDYVSSGDVNNDGHLDFFYHYDTGRLFLSNGDGTYTQDARGISVVTGNREQIGSAWGDYDNDGDLDLYCPRYDDGSRGYLWRNDGVSFTDVTLAAGITDTSGQRSVCWGDYDNDGDLDLYIVTHAGGDNLLYRNQGDGTFTSVDEGALAAGKGHDAVFVDFDNDGDLDLAVTQQRATNTLLLNGTNGNAYLKVRVLGGGRRVTNRAAIGVRIELFEEDGTTFLGRRDIGTARGFGGTEPLWAHFGGVDPDQTYRVVVHLASGPVTIDVIPAEVSTTIGVTTIPQMLTVEEPPAPTPRLLLWTEVDPNDQ